MSCCGFRGFGQLCLALLCALLLCFPAAAELQEGYCFQLSGGGARILRYEGDLTGVLELPAELGGCPVTEIGDYAFAYQNITALVLPEGLTAIGVCAFSGCYLLREVYFPEGLKTIGADAFLCCEKLREISLPDGLESIGCEAFYNCLGLESIHVGGNTRIGERAFEGCPGITPNHKTQTPYPANPAAEEGAEHHEYYSKRIWQAQ